MVKVKSSTKSDLIEALEEVGVATKRDLSDELAEFHENITKPDLDKRFEKVEGRLTKVENRLMKVENEIRWTKDEVKGLESDFSTTVSISKFNKLKARVDRHHPVN